MRYLSSVVVLKKVRMLLTMEVDTVLIVGMFAEIGVEVVVMILVVVASGS